MQTITIDEYFQNWTHLPVIDVRSPSEYTRGHIPNAISLPLFNDEERATVGTIFKEKGQENAIEKGLEIAGQKMSEYVSLLKKMVGTKEIVVHCWRGGRRSASLAWLFSFVGYKVLVISKGYKSYRGFVQKMIDDANLKIIILGGKTGSGKTPILHELQQQGEQIIDLERLANHKGSAFGSIGEDPQPFTEFFENQLYHEIRELDSSKRVWIENESKSIGRVYLPDTLWSKMKKSPLIHLEIPLHERTNHLAEIYGDYNNADLKKAFISIQKRIGGAAFKEAIEHLENNDFESAAAIALYYYDRTYTYNLEVNKSPSITILNFERIEPKEIAKALIRHVSKTKEYQVNTV